MRFTTVLATLVAAVAAAKDERTFAVLHHYGQGPLTTCRADPIISPGGPSSHVHTVMGASNFGFNATGETLRQSKCTTAMAKADLSAYWFPTLYFQDPATKLLEPVKMFYMNVYYFFEPTHDDIKAFPVGLKMVSGDAMLRTPPATTGDNQLDPSKGPIQPVQMTCPRSSYDPPSWPADSKGLLAGIASQHDKGAGIGFPFEDCDGYASPLRVDIHFPSCYNPKAGLENYQNNMQFPSDAGDGKSDCPPGWIHTPHIFFETYWNTHELLPRFQSTLGKSSPFVFSNGDATGFSAHGDFIAGWDEEELQHIIDTCNAGHAGIDTCPGLKYGANDPSDSCTIECPVDEKVDGKLEKLPGNNPLAGWAFGGGDILAPSPSPSPSPSSKPQPGNGDNTPPKSSSTKPSTTLIAIPSPSKRPSHHGHPHPNPKPSSSASSFSAAAVPAPSPKPSPKPVEPIVHVATVVDTVTVWETTTVYEDDLPAPTGAAEKHAARHYAKHAARRYHRR
ncbi:hypothetical protein B0J18DRAFT_397774 [Chaetomium sp. MPI-SDFR-AT-0129]|nr:hypothetical protein B0J18DRAFT_397774 [Chaetomium sp. MPI-SDFR-AT-0129]